LTFNYFIVDCLFQGQCKDAGSTWLDGCFKYKCNDGLYKLLVGGMCIYNFKIPTPITGLVQRWHHYNLIDCNLFSPLYGWKVVHLAINNNYSLTLITDIETLIGLGLGYKCYSLLSLFVQLYHDYKIL